MGGMQEERNDPALHPKIHLNRAREEKGKVLRSTESPATGEVWFADQCSILTLKVPAISGKRVRKGINKAIGATRLDRRRL